MRPSPERSQEAALIRRMNALFMLRKIGGDVAVDEISRVVSSTRQSCSTTSSRLLPRWPDEKRTRAAAAAAEDRRQHRTSGCDHNRAPKRPKRSRLHGRGEESAQLLEKGSVRRSTS